MEGGCERVNQVEESRGQLISGLPDDVALFCLARVPRKYHAVLKCVCRKWRDLVCSEEWYAYRLNNNLSETWIYALCRDKFELIWCYELDPYDSRRCWRLVQGLPSQCLKRKGMGFETLGKKVYLLGGCGWSEDATDEAYCFDVARNSWSGAASLSTARCYFACQVMDGKIYAIGGLSSKLSDQPFWDTYDPQKNCWEPHSDAKICHDVTDSIVLDGKIYIRCGASSATSRVYAIFYEPLEGTWQHADADMASGWKGPAVVVDGTLYVLDQSSGTRLMMWQKDKREWVAVGRLSSLLTRPPCRIVAIGKRIYIIGKGLSTVVLDLDKTRNMDGVMVGSSMPGFISEDNVISCKCVAL
ncbi:F-box/kelch-repeat protein SKIP4 [Mercurialis annua]|uniref:F-box/kelch-repeat protein SKIP4 n=1 Tax=Mercurialis annua TaxID=3986 RepID=UPI00215F10E9|nr:F-box/kelch-repeat protein SKIP4 [Mercurialis annua]